MESFLGKKVVVIVAFSVGRPNSCGPMKMLGVLEKIENEFCVFSNVKEEGFSWKDYSNNVIINKQYITMIAEA